MNKFFDRNIVLIFLSATVHASCKRQGIFLAFNLHIVGKGTYSHNIIILSNIIIMYFVHLQMEQFFLVYFP